MRRSAIFCASVFLMGLAAASSACGSSQVVLPTCSLEAGVCQEGLTCVNLSALGPDGTCHGIGAVCSLACVNASDCAPMGKNAVCSTACSTVTIGDGGTMGICTPYQ